MASSMEVDVFEEQSTSELRSLLNHGEMLLREGRLNEAFEQFSKLYRTGHVDSTKLGVLITSLVEYQTRKIEQERLKHATRTDDTFLCLLCHDFLCDPVSMSCGHTFCRVCVDEDNSKVCQKCGSTTLEQTYSLNVLLASTLAKWFPSRVKASEMKRKGKSYLKAGEPLQAMDTITKSLEVYPDDPKSYLLRCEAYSTIGLMDEAQEDARRACQLKPFEAKAFFNLGMTMKLRNRPDEAVMAFLRALALDSSNTECRELLTETLQKLLSPISAEEQLNMVAGRSKSIFNPTDSPLSLKLSVPVYDVNLSQDDFAVDQRLKDPDDFECKLCFGLLYRPVTTPCGHTFCLECLERTMDHTLLCPCCRFRLNDFLASGKHKIVTETVEYVLEKYFPEEYIQRKKSHDEKLQQLACVGQKQHFEVPMFVCAFSVPDIKCPLHIFEPRYRLMIRHCLESGLRQFGMCLSDQRGSYVDYGTMMEIISVEFFPDGRSVIDTIGGRRFHVLTRGRRDGYDTAVVEWVSDNLDEFEDDQDLHELLSVNCSVYRLGQVWFSRLAQDQQSCILNALGQFPPIDPDPRILPNGPSWIWWLLQAMPLDQKAKLIILSMTSVRERLLSLQRFLSILIRMQTKNMAETSEGASNSPSQPSSSVGPSGLL